MPEPAEAPEPEPEAEPEPAEPLPSRWATDPADPEGAELLPANELILDFPGAASAAVQIASDLHLEFIREGCGAELDMDAMIVPSAPILALLGDIGIPTHTLYREFLLHQAGRFAAVLVLTGNHEFYDVGHTSMPAPRVGQTYSDASREWGRRPRHSAHDMELQIQAICEEHASLHYIDNRVVRLGCGKTAPALLCTPLWSHIPAPAMGEVARSLNDYRMAYVQADPPCPMTDWRGDNCEDVKGVQNSRGQALRRLTPQDTSRWHGLAVRFIQREVCSPYPWL